MSHKSVASISLYQDPSVIEEYNELDFSDEKSRDQFSSSDELNGCHELSKDKLRFLGVEQFPTQFAMKLDPDTQEETYLAHLNQTGQPSQNPKTAFSIDSFLNAQPLPAPRNLQPQGHQSKLGYLKPSYTRKNSHNKSIRPPLNSFAQITQEKHINSESSGDSITLVTLTEPESKQQTQQPRLLPKNSMRQQIFALRFQQAKLNFFDNFLPYNMKIKNSPYAFFKYSQAKRNNKIL